MRLRRPWSRPPVIPGAEVGDLLAGCVQHRVTEQGEGTDAPVRARNGGVPHGRKGTAIRECEWISIG